jgi:hypothetical protein
MTFKSTHEKLKSIKGRTKEDLWERITDIPEFDPKKHSDGCSGGMSVFYANFRKKHPKLHLKEELPWRKCCEVHDRAYYYGGTRDEKKAADEALKQCVAQTIDQDITGILLGSAMEIAVTIGGLPYFNTSYRWGYGEDFRGTEALPAKANDEE